MKKNKKKEETYNEKRRNDLLHGYYTLEIKMKFKIVYEDEKPEFYNEWEYTHYVSAMFAWKTITEVIDGIRRCNYKHCKSGRDIFFKWRIWENTTKSLYLKDENDKILKVYNFKEKLK